MTDTEERDAFSLNEFCRRHSISRAGFYNALHAGTAPKIMKFGSKTLISRESAAEWRHARESEAGTPTRPSAGRIGSLPK